VERKKKVEKKAYKYVFKGTYDMDGSNVSFQVKIKGFKDRVKRIEYYEEDF